MSGYWHSRIGRLFPDNKDLWWDLGTGTDIPQLAAEITTTINKHALPAMHARMTEK